MSIDYKDLFKDLKAYLLNVSPKATRDITATIKRFFHDLYAPQGFTVLPTPGGTGKDGEYMLDLIVANYNPRDTIEEDMDLDPNLTKTELLLSVESELGGESASSGRLVMRNVVEDYIKLLLVRSSYRVLIFTSLPTRSEHGDHVLARVERLRQLYERSCQMEGRGVLLVHLDGTKPNSSQVQAVVSENSIRGFIISPDGKKCSEIKG